MSYPPVEEPVGTSVRSLLRLQPLAGEIITLASREDVLGDLRRLCDWKNGFLSGFKATAVF